MKMTYYPGSIHLEGSRNNENTRIHCSIDSKNILNKWDFIENSSINQIVMLNLIDKFPYDKKLIHIFAEINRVMKSGGKLIINWTDIKGLIEKYYGTNDKILIEKIHEKHWGFTTKTFPTYLGNNWTFEFNSKNFPVKDENLMQTCIATKK